MNTHSTPSTSTDLESLVEPLISAFAREHTMLRELEERLADKLEAIRTRNPEQLAETTHDISQTNQQLDALSRQRTRQMKRLGQALDGSEDVHSLDELLAACEISRETTLEETLSNWQTRMREQAIRTQERCEEVTFALQYATRLGQEMLQALRGHSPSTTPEGTEAYTATGTAATTTSSSTFVNHVG